MADADKNSWDRKEFQAYKDGEDIEALILEVVDDLEVTSTPEVTQRLIDRRFKEEIKKYENQVKAKLLGMINQGNIESTHNMRIKLPKSQPEQG